MSWLKNIHFGETGAQKAVLVLGACAVAGMAAVQLTRTFAGWREKHLTFDFPLEEELFIGWGGFNPQHVRHPV